LTRPIGAFHHAKLLSPGARRPGLLGDQITSLDPPKHTRHRALIGRFFTPNRLKENEEFMCTLAEGLIDEFADRGEVDFSNAYAKPFTLLVIADLLGVPREDHATFRGWLGAPKGTVGDPQGRDFGDQVFANLHPYFARYIEERRTTPRDDVMSKLASVRFRDGELPEVMAVVRLAAILFAAGQETTAHLFCAGMRFLCEQPGLAAELRRDPGIIPNFVEECLRLESPIKRSFPTPGFPDEEDRGGSCFHLSSFAHPEQAESALAAKRLGDGSLGRGWVAARLRAECLTPHNEFRISRSRRGPRTVGLLAPPRERTLLFSFPSTLRAQP
jgi:cytochrome P450